jgi:hypothetical protein
MPVGTIALSNGASVRDSVRLALKSIPEDPAVAYAGSGLVELLMILTFNSKILYAKIHYSAFLNNTFA